MLIVSDHKLIPFLDDSYDIYNYSGLAEGYIKLNILPTFSHNNIETRSFDLKYAEYIFNNDVIFKSFFRIILSLYNGRNVFIMTYRSDMLDIIIDSFIKLIQQRYGYNAQFVNEFSDINIYDTSSFSVEGLINLEADFKRYNMISG